MIDINCRINDLHTLYYYNNACFQVTTAMEGWRGLYFLLLVLFRTDHHRVEAELVQTFDVLEGVPIGTIIGVIGSDTGGSDIPQPPYLIVPLAGSSDPDADLIINQKTGEIRTKSELDREKTRSYSLSAIPVNGDSISVTVRVQDVNDNSPEFVPDVLQLDIPENIPSGTRRKLAPAVDQVRVSAYYVQLKNRMWQYLRK